MTNKTPFSVGGGSNFLTFRRGAVQQGRRDGRLRRIVHSGWRRLRRGWGGLRLGSLTASQRAYFGVAGGVSSPGDDVEDGVGILGSNSLGEDVPLSQNYGTSLGVDSGQGDAPALLDSYIDPVLGEVRESVKMRFDDDVTPTSCTCSISTSASESTWRSAGPPGTRSSAATFQATPTSTASKPSRSASGFCPQGPICTSSTPGPRASATRDLASTA